ncbi:hypothetical protein B0T26DRAFT_435138 [Lasiosphaeria miniovina]|uniref:DUF8040 domain-containing protein n=1 Tax=Lasiosphaeria miniovina TaxID=1954250 RepID=A0AA40DP00_9PEZI|nr:uncharacterized protein B0T26DRAFT_435138 [Lasiosphaeria miniovina]KAK0710285.1 hypothetical protein B0T26DRAFT_435138 [Lasiosphaeria miniovina]
MPNNALKRASRRRLQRMRRMRLCVLLVVALAMPRRPYTAVNINVLKGQFVTHDLLHGHAGKLFGLIRMRAPTFFALVTWSRHNTTLQASRHVGLEEKVLIFMVVVSPVLSATLILASRKIRLPEPATPRKIETNPIYYPYFSNCLGAITAFA